MEIYEKYLVNEISREEDMHTEWEMERRQLTRHPKGDPWRHGDEDMQPPELKPKQFLVDKKSGGKFYIEWMKDVHHTHFMLVPNTLQAHMITELLVDAGYKEAL